MKYIKEFYDTVGGDINIDEQNRTVDKYNL
jgi:hypothetical protein